MTINLQRNARKGRDGYKIAARMLRTVPKLIKKGKHDYKPAAECWNEQGRLQSCSKIGRDVKQERQA